MVNVNDEFDKVRYAFKIIKRENVELRRRVEKLEQDMLLVKTKNNNSSNTIILKENEAKTYVGNNKSFKIHNSNCPYAAKLKRENREHFETLEDALRKKYKKCSCITN